MRNNVFADQLSKALEEKKNDVNTFVWKGAKKYVNGQCIQEEIRLMDASDEQLRQFYAHCKSMLYSTDKENPGRYTLLKIIDDQQNRCNAELYIRNLREKQTFPTHLFYKQFDALLDTLTDKYPRSTWDTTGIGKVIEVPADFSDVPISIIRDACLDNLGKFNKKHITLNFLLKQGLWFDKNEIKEYLTVTDENGKLMDKLEVVKKNLNLRPDIKLRTNYNSGLSYLEFRAMYHLHDMRYCDMNNVQLVTLRNKILFRLANEASEHAKLWEEKIMQIEKVCEIRGIKPE